MHTLIHTQARHVRPIAAGGAVDVLHTAEICTLLRLRFLLLLAGRRVEAHALHTRASPGVH
jgi:hypothetical protein